MTLTLIAAPYHSLYNRPQEAVRAFTLTHKKLEAHLPLLTKNYETDMFPPPDSDLI